MGTTPGTKAIGNPTRTAWGVFSEQSGALVIGPVDDRNVAADEADRLNGEAARVTGVVEGAVRFAVQQEGVQTRYVLGPIDVPDEQARRAAFTQEAKALAKAKKSADADTAEVIDAALERIRVELDEDS